MLGAITKSIFLGLLLGGLLASSTAVAQELSAQELQEQEEVERLSAAGVAAYKAKEYSKAVGLFQQALAIQPVPNLLYNIARACELMGDERKAVFYYTKFIRSDGVSDAARDKARGRLSDLEARMLAAAPAPEPRPGDRDDARGPVVLGSTDSDTGLNSMEVAGWVTASGGGALVVISTILAARMAEEQDSFTDTTDLEQKKVYRQNAEALGLTADVGFGVGAALLATGATLLTLEWLEADAGDKETTFRVAPDVHTDGFGLSGALSF